MAAAEVEGDNIQEERDNEDGAGVGEQREAVVEDVAGLPGTSEEEPTEPGGQSGGGPHADGENVELVEPVARVAIAGTRLR